VGHVFFERAKEPPTNKLNRAIPVRTDGNIQLVASSRVVAGRREGRARGPRDVGGACCRGEPCGNPGAGRQEASPLPERDAADCGSSLPPTPSRLGSLLSFLSSDFLRSLLIIQLLLPSS
jgi:hypothetical protein